MSRIARCFVYIFLVLGIIACLCVGYFNKEEKAINALDTAGYSDITITSHHWFAVGLLGCSHGDASKFDAIATNPAGKQVELYVCTGFWFKGSTIRTY